MKQLLLWLLPLLFTQQLAYCQADTTIDLYIAHDSVLAGVQQDSIYRIPIFTDTNINKVIGKYTITKFEKAVPSSRFATMRQLYSIVCNNTYMAQELVDSFPAVFHYFEVTPPPTILSRYTPNDWHGSIYTNPWALDYIKVRDAWGLYPGIDGARGKPSVIIGVTDTYFGLDHPDLASQIVYCDANTYNPSSGPKNHGSFVAGMVAAHTDNAVGYPGIAMNCKLRVSTNISADEMFNMTQPGPYKVRVLNASWGSGSPNLISTWSSSVAPRKFNEVYENGVVCCAAAGNGYNDPAGNRPWYYLFPASYDNVISTTHIGNKNCDWVEDGPQNNVGCNEHNIVHGDTTASGYAYKTYNHNTRVDICAPAHNVGGLIYDETATGDARYYAWERSGTSFASPMTAGVVGLMASVNECLSPYQLECILKSSSNPEIYSVPDNAYFVSPQRLGAGALDAHKAIIESSLFNCNDPATQTFEIEGIEINTLCAPGHSSNGVKPQLSVKLKNGTPPYKYHWTRISNGLAHANVNIDDITSPNPTMIDYNIGSPISTAGILFNYFLTVEDNSPIPKVAKQLIQIRLRTDNTYQLASRDSYVDMMDEPNGQELVDPRDWHYWASPDVWNRHLADGNTTPQDVEYFSNGDPNYAYVRIRNVGCAAYPNTDNAQVHLYWTLQSTGESWPTDWTIANAAAVPAGLVEAGREITASGTLHVPDLEPGASYIGYKSWQPVNPFSYKGTPSSVNLCFLSRIWEPALTQNGMFAVEGSNTTTNVKNNNNIVTRNMSLVNLGRKKAPRKTTRLYVSNVSNVSANTFSLQMLTDRDIHLHFAGNPSQYMYVALHMDSGLYSRWVTGGHLGSYASYNNNEYTVYYDPASPLRLDGIVLDTMEKHAIDMEFTMRNGVPVRAPFAPQTFHFRQLVDTTTADSVYGCVSFTLGIEQDDTLIRRGALVVTEAGQGPDNDCQYIEMIAANCGTNMGKEVDLRGWIINDNAG